MVGFITILVFTLFMLYSNLEEKSRLKYKLSRHIETTSLEYLEEIEEFYFHERNFFLSIFNLILHFVNLIYFGLTQNYYKKK